MSTVFDSSPNLAHVVPDSKKQLKGKDLDLFFCNTDTDPESITSPYFTLLPSNLPSQCPEQACPPSTDVRSVLPTPVSCSLRKDGIDAVVIDNVLSEEECAYLCSRIDESDSLSFWSAAGRANEAARQFRDANTVEMEAPELAETIYNRIKHLIIADTDCSDSNSGSGSGSDGDCGVCPSCVEISRPDEVEYEIGSEYYEAHKGDLDSTLYEKNLVGKWSPIGLNADLLLAQYPIGGAFAPHTDGRAIRDFNTGSFYSAIVYLSTIPAGHGGGTRFYKDGALSNLVKKSENERENESESEAGVASETGDSGSNMDTERWTVADAYLLADTREKSTVRAVAGRVLIFNQKLAHEGLPTCVPRTAIATNGTKVVERDYMKFIIRSDVMYQRTPQLFTSDRDREAYRLFQQAEVLAEACPMRANPTENEEDDEVEENSISNVDQSILLFKKAMKLSPELAIFCGYT